ncbi:MAG: VWA domain-containing protein [Chloroflexaceae bacterium]|nr:VWA domain-containing protein [Chloroflexaceae bacterium]
MLLLLLVVVGLVSQGFGARASVAPLPSPAVALAPEKQQFAHSFEQQVIERTNQEREKAGLLPLKANPQLARAALEHSQAMAEHDFMSHDNPVTGSTAGDRIRAAGYTWSSSAENIASGQASPDEVVASWMNSPGHRANLLSPDLREIGVGYVLDENDTHRCGDLPCLHYWTQDFGSRSEVYPLVINGEAMVTTTPQVSLALHGEPWSQEMRLRNENEPFTAWEPFQSTYSWQLVPGEGERTVTVELRNGSNIITASDTISLTQTLPPAAQPTTGTVVGPHPLTPSPLPPPLTPTPMQFADLSFKRQVSPAQVLTGEEVEVRLTLSSTLDACDPTVARTPLDAVLVIDHSSSMAGTPLAEAKEAAKTFVDEMDLSTDQVGVVQFDNGASLVHSMSQDAGSLKQAIDGISGGDNTAIDRGLAMAYEELTGAGQRAGARKVIVLLSDGGSNRSAANAQADRAKNDGIRIVTVGLDTGSNEDLLKELASKDDTGQPEYYPADTSNLVDVYREIASSIQFAPITNLVFKHTFDASDFDLIPGSIAPPGEVNINTITWNLDRLGAGDQPFTYRLRSRTPGEFKASRGDEITYLRCEQTTETISTEPELPVQVQDPTPTTTPSPTVTPTPSITPTPRPTMLPPIEPPSGPSSSSVVVGLCSDFPWWLILSLVLVALFLLLAWKFNLAGLRTWLRQRRRWPRWCEIAGLLIPAYLLFLIPLLLSQFLPLVCLPREVVYFWRIDSGTSLLMMKPVDPAMPVRPMHSLNRKSTCVACHAVSRQGGHIAAVTEGGNGPVVVQRLDGKDIPIPPINASFVSWSPDGSKLVYSANDEDLYVLDLATGTTAPLVGASDPNVAETMPAWSHDGRMIAFVRPASGTATSYQIDVPTDIYLVPATGGAATLVPGASGSGFNYYPSFSPDGRWLAFTHHTEGSSTYSDPQAEIYLVPPAGGVPRRLPANDGADGQLLGNVGNSWPTWSRDGRFLAFNSKRNENQYDIFIAQIGADGNSSPAQPLEGANDPTAFEHLPFWGAPPQPDILAGIFGLWPWFLPFLPLLALAWFCCQRPKPIPHTLALKGEVSPKGGRLGRDEFTVELELTGNVAPCRSITRTATEDPQVVATGVQFEHQFDATNFDLVPGHTVPPPDHMGVGTMTWHLDQFPAGQQNFRYRLRPRGEGSFDIAQGNQIHYLKCGEEPGVLHPKLSLPVTVSAVRVRPPRVKVKLPPEPVEIRLPEIIWQPDTALVIGVGGTGRWVLTHLKKNLRDAGAGQLPEDVPMIVIDTSEYELLNHQKVAVEFAGCSIDPGDPTGREMVFAINENLAPTIKRMVQNAQAEPILCDWFPYDDYHTLVDAQKNLAQGTHGRRPLARAGLVRELQRMDRPDAPEGEGEEARLWRLLTRTTRQVRGEQGVRVILVGSLAGGMSGILFDIAHLVRLAAWSACGQDTVVSLEAYLALDRVFTTLAADPAGLAANTFAALRELRRFQLNPGIPYPMYHQAPSSLPSLAEGCDQVLFTDVCFFGGQVAMGTDPTISTFPAMADIISQRLDRASMGVGQADWISDMRVAVQNYREGHHELALGTAGSFLYRLPTYDLVEQVKVTWSRALVQAFLMGDDRGNTLHLDHALVTDPGLTELTRSPDELVLMFLDGWLQADPTASRMEIASALSCLVTDSNDDRLDHGLDRASQSSSPSPSHEQVFREELSAALRWILLGTEKAELSQARVGKLAYALAFLDTLVARLTQAEGAVEQMRHHPNTPTRRVDQAQSLQEVCSIYRKVAETYRSKLRQTARAISRTALHDTGGDPGPGLFDALEERANQVRERRKAMDALLVRRYLWTVREQTGVTDYRERELGDIWYQDYATDRRSPIHYVEYLSWDVQPDGELVLTLLVHRSDQQRRVVLRHLEDVPSFLESLLDLAGSVLHGIWQANTLQEVMESHGLLSQQSGEVAEQLQDGAGPILTFDSNRAPQAQYRTLFAATGQFHAAARAIQDTLAQRRQDHRGMMNGSLTPLTLTDRFACQVIRTADAIPLEAVDRLVESRGEEHARAAYLHDPKQRVVFAAEAQAERWERHRRIEQDGMGDLVLHPLVVAGLAEPERARCYALALASGFIHQGKEQLAVRMPGQNQGYTLVQFPGARGIDPLVMGLLRFCLQPSADLIEAMETLRQIVDEPSDDLVSRWRTWSQGVPRDFQQGTADRKDLGQWVRLVVRYELAQWFQRQNIRGFDSTRS